jgi:hypothetical protein
MDEARRKVLARRRFALIALGVAALITLVAAIVTGSFLFLIITLVVDVLLAIYVAILLQVKQRSRAATPSDGARHGTGDRPSAKVVGG